MIVLDTNVVSAMMRLEREPSVRDWLNRQAIERLFVTSVTIFEIQFGLEKLPAGKRKREALVRFSDIVATAFSARVLNLDFAVAVEAARVHVARGNNNANSDTPDSLIAGTALRLGASIATRNAKDFKSLGVPLINPWTD